jgi:hypothetical protein
MFSDASKALKSFFTSKRTVILVVSMILMFGLSSYASSKSYVMDRFEDGNTEEVNLPITQQPVVQESVPTPPNSLLQGVANPSELLPNDSNAEWSSLNPTSMNGEMPDLLTAGAHIGLDTIGQTMKNANLQLRSDPIIAKADTGPWNQSTIDTDYARTPFELGQ